MTSCSQDRLDLGDLGLDWLGYKGYKEKAFSLVYLGYVAVRSLGLEQGAVGREKRLPALLASVPP